MKRTIQFGGKTYKSLKTTVVTIKLRKVKTTKLFQHHIKTDGGYHDVAVELDRWGRLKRVDIERSRY